MMYKLNMIIHLYKNKVLVQVVAHGKIELSCLALDIEKVADP